MRITYDATLIQTEDMTKFSVNHPDDLARREISHPDGLGLVPYVVWMTYEGDRSHPDDLCDLVPDDISSG